MARKKSEDKNIRKLVKVGGGKTYSITLPIDMIRDLGWRQGQKLDIKKYGKGIIIRDWNKDKK